jgi:hypothetical protein
VTKGIAVALNIVGGFALLGVVSCSKQINACEQLAEACHHLGGTQGLGHECHEIGHDGVIGECNSQLEACLAFCAMPADGGGQSDATEAGQD